MRMLTAVFAILLSANCFADSYTLEFPTRTLTGTSCPSAEFWVFPEFGTTVAECAVVVETTTVYNHDPVSGLSYFQGVRLDAGNIYTECQFYSAKLSAGVGLEVWFLCLEPVPLRPPSQKH